MLTADLQIVDDNRSSERRKLDTFVNFREMGQVRRAARVLDISREGFRIEAATNLREGTSVWITLPGLAPQLARVAWATSAEAGCRFIAPLHPAVFEHLVTG